MLSQHTAVSRQVIAAIVAAPAHVAQETMPRIESDDFDWIHARIFAALKECSFAEHQEPGSIVIQVHKALLEAGEFQATDNGLRQAMQELAQTTGHPEMLPMFINELVERRFRRAVGDFALSVAQHAEASPLEDVDASLRGMDELRRLRSRILTTKPAPALKSVKAQEVSA